jgi:hypothetical protein
MSNPEFATLARDALQRILTTPSKAWSVRTGETYEAPPISRAFHLDEVILDSSQAYQHLVVKFRWDGEDSLFAVSYRVDQDDDVNCGEGPEGFAISVKVALAEDLLALGYTLSNAVREPREGVVWVRWIARNERPPVT